MNTPTAEFRSFEFRFPHLDTMLRLEVQGESVTIYASRNTFSSRRKEMFIRELAAEGFIPDNVACGLDKGTGGLRSGVRWLLDDEMILGDASEANAQRFVRRVFASSCLLVGVFYVIIFGGSIYNGGAPFSMKQVGAIHGSPMAVR
jgi:hypothetical protein